MYALGSLRRFVVHGSDGQIVGRLDDVYLDDRDWVARHLVIDTGRPWRRGRRLLIPPAAARCGAPGQRRLQVGSSHAQIEQSPPVDAAKPVSRQQDIDLCDYFGFPYDWSGPAIRAADLSAAAGRDPHLRSARALTRCRVEVGGRVIGRAGDVLIDVDSWAARHLVVRGRRGSPARRALVATERVARVDWGKRAIVVDVPAEAACRAPALGPSGGARRVGERVASR